MVVVGVLVALAIVRMDGAESHAMSKFARMSVVVTVCAAPIATETSLSASVRSGGKDQVAKMLRAHLAVLVGPKGIKKRLSAPEEASVTFIMRQHMERALRSACALKDSQVWPVS